MSNAEAASTQLHEKWLTLARAAWYVCAVFAAIVLLAALPVYFNRVTNSIAADTYGVGQFNAPFQILLDVGDLGGSYISFALAILLFWRKPNDRMALFVSFFCLFTAVTGLHVLDYTLTAYFGAPSSYQLLSDLQTPLWILLFCIFPDGRFVPRWTRWLVIVSIPTSLPLELVTHIEWSLVSNILTFALFVLVVFATVYRYRRVSNYAERKQTKWWLYGLFVALVLAAIASLVFKYFAPPLLNVTPVFLTIAILRSRLWDIDIIIRKTVTYSIVVGLLLFVYFGSVILLQQIFANVTGQRSEVITVLSTLVIAALFIPLRDRIQNVIDKRFYRKKYDAQQVLQKFAVTVRDETDLEKLTTELVNVVQETMQPTKVSVWLKRTTEDGRQTTGK
jgi:hypothetical protein